MTKNRISKTCSMWALTLCVLAGLSCLAGAACAEGPPSMFGSTSWFDWSDFRANACGRVFLAKLQSGSLRTAAGEFDLKSDFGFKDDPEPFKELFAELYIDRLGLRLSVEESQKFIGALDAVPGQASALNIGCIRLGGDIDLLRFPYFRFGVNGDFQGTKPSLQDQRSISGETFKYKGNYPITAGFQCRALPGRIRQIPITLEGRVRFPVVVPTVNSKDPSKITEFEVSGGLRPSVWETSMFGHSTFAASVELGYRLTDLNMTVSGSPTVDGQGNVVGAADVTLKARWSGAFLQVALFH